jgi:hypothetical protein
MISRKGLEASHPFTLLSQSNQSLKSDHSGFGSRFGVGASLLTEATTGQMALVMIGSLSTNQLI